MGGRKTRCEAYHACVGFLLVWSYFAISHQHGDTVSNAIGRIVVSGLARSIVCRVAWLGDVDFDAKHASDFLFDGQLHQNLDPMLATLCALFFERADACA
jgi:hypothetical protein